MQIKHKKNKKKIKEQAKQSVQELILGLKNAISYNQIYQDKINNRIIVLQNKILNQINKVQEEQNDLISQISEKQNLINEFEKSKLEFNRKENLKKEIENLEENLRQINKLNVNISSKITVQSKLNVEIEEDTETFRVVKAALDTLVTEADTLKDNIKTQTESLNKSLGKFEITDSIINYSDKKMHGDNSVDPNSFDNTNDILEQLNNIKAHDKLKTQGEITDEDINKLKNDLATLEIQKNTSQEMLKKFENYNEKLNQASKIAEQHQETERVILDYFTSFVGQITKDESEQKTLIKALIKENNSLNIKKQMIFLQRIEKINKNLEIANKIEKLEGKISISKQQKDQIPINEIIKLIKNSKADVIDNLKKGIIPITYTLEETNGNGEKSNAEKSLTSLEMSISSLESKLKDNIEKQLEKERTLRDKKLSITDKQKKKKQDIVKQIDRISLDYANTNTKENKTSQIEKLIEINKELEDRTQERKENRSKIIKCLKKAITILETIKTSIQSYPPKRILKEMKEIVNTINKNHSTSGVPN